MSELLLKKVMLIRDRIAKLRAALPQDPNAVSKDERLEAFISFHLLLLVQDAIDLGAHLLAARSMPMPGSQREMFEALSKAGVLSSEVAQGMSQMASLRNRIAHSYGELDPVRMVREAPQGLDGAERFLVEIIRTIPP